MRVFYLLQREMSRTVSNLLTVLDEVSTTQLSTRLEVDGEVGLVQSGNGGELTVQVLQTLTNVAALNDHHHLFANSIPRSVIQGQGVEKEVRFGPTNFGTAKTSVINKQTIKDCVSCY